MSDTIAAIATGGVVAAIIARMFDDSLRKSVSLG